MAQDMNKHNLSISSSKKKKISFFCKILCFFLIFVCFLNFCVFPQYIKGYDASLIDKVDRLESYNDSKIVLLGNSNLSFGIDSQILEEEMGMPVVNMGLHGSLGNAFHEKMAKVNVSKGDIYILCHTVYNDSNAVDDAALAWSVIENHFQLWKFLRLRDIETMVRAFPIYLKKALALQSAGTGNQNPDNIYYARNAFNEYGDVAEYREGSQYTFEEKVEAPVIGDITARRINELSEYLNARGAVLLVAAYPIGNGELTANASDFVRFQIELEKRLECDVISNFADYMLDYSYFFNTDFHLNTAGAKLRTEQLVSDLKRWQKKQSDALMEDDIYTDIIGDANLSHISDMNTYLEALEKGRDRYSIIFSVKDDASSALNSSIYKKLNHLGLKTDLTELFQYSYIAIIDKGVVRYEEANHEKIITGGSFDDGMIEYSVTSAGWDRGCISSIVFNNVELSRNKKGLNIVVYSNETHRILDSVTFDMSSAELAATRQGDIDSK